MKEHILLLNEKARQPSIKLSIGLDGEEWLNYAQQGCLFDVWV